MFKLNKKQRCISITFIIGVCSIITADLYAANQSLFNEKNIKMLSSTFVNKGCNTNFVEDQNKISVFSNKWGYLYSDPSEEADISTLSKNEKCLLSRMTELSMYDSNDVEIKQLSKLSYIEFSAPQGMLKKCNLKGEQISPYIVQYNQSEGKLKRRIIKNDNANFECFLGLIK